ncbi:MAG: NAD(P)-dependent glycerol-3-phosphate dehydrogenase [Gammaproteobacteria bacterium]|nr:NAD(P)-dependent glycerol-3-phosphate dehydrogenase [Gammaproteobacteria bacterium]
MNTQHKTVAVLGAGSWGTALAIHLARAGLNVRLWGNSPEHIALLQQQRCNRQYLPDVAFPETLELHSRLEDTLRGDQLLVLIVIPSHAYRSFLNSSTTLFTPSMSIAWASKGLEEGTGKLLHQVINEEIPQCDRLAVISGPTFAGEVARDLPTAITVASDNEEVANEWRDCLHNGYFRAYTSNDIKGVELGGALKNPLAIAAGIADGLGFGANSRAALITRGLAEVMRLGDAMGCKRETFMGLAGLGDLVLTCTDDQSRNRRTGLLLAQGLNKQQIADKIGQEIEGVRSSLEAVRLGRMYEVELPIIEQVHKVLYEGFHPHDAVRSLLERKSIAELI